MIEFDFVGQVNGRIFRRVRLRDSVLRKYGTKSQPSIEDAQKIFIRDILPTISQYEVAESYDIKSREQVHHLTSSTVGDIGFSTGYRDTILKFEGDTLVVFHHGPRRKKQYERLMNRYYPAGIKRVYK